MTQPHRAAHVLRRLRHLVAPATGAVYLVLWIVAEAGRSELGGHVLVVAAFAVAIGLAGWMPATALGLAVVVPLLQSAHLLARPSATTWPEYLAVAFVVGFVGAGRSALLRYLALPVLAAAAAAAAWAMVVPTVADQDVWAQWVGSGGRTRADLAMIGLAWTGVFGIAWAVGVAVGAAWRLGLARVRVVEAERETEVASAELRAEQDRARIARDVHDSLAHSLAVVVSQAQGAAALAARDEHAVRALDDIAAVSRAALGDVRSLVERIQTGPDGAVSPGAQGQGLGQGPGQRQGSGEGSAGPSALPGLVAEMHALGMDATFEEHGDRDALAPATGNAVHRIVQESLTNVLKHQGRSAAVQVVLDWRGPGLAIVVTSSGDAPLVRLDGDGAGVRGMEERARLAGGWLRSDAGDAEHEWVVTAWLPTTAPGRSAA